MKNKGRSLIAGLLLMSMVVALAVCSLILGGATFFERKTILIAEIDSWQPVVAGTMVVGDSLDTSRHYSCLLYIETALVEAVAHGTGVEVIIEVSYADADWNTLTTFRGTIETAAASTTSGAVTDANTVIDVTDPNTGDFDVIGRKWFILDSTYANSESVKTNSLGALLAVTLTSAIQRSHVTGVAVYDRVDDWVVSIPDEVGRVRILVNNDDSDCDVAFTSRASFFMRR